jgi:hypothetical protein
MQQFKNQSCAFLNYEIRKTRERGQSTKPPYDFRAFRVFRSFRLLVCYFQEVA